MYSKRLFSPVRMYTVTRDAITEITQLKPLVLATSLRLKAIDILARMHLSPNGRLPCGLPGRIFYYVRSTSVSQGTAPAHVTALKLQLFPPSHFHYQLASNPSATAMNSAVSQQVLFFLRFVQLGSTVITGFIACFLVWWHNVLWQPTPPALIAVICTVLFPSHR